MWPISGNQLNADTDTRSGAVNGMRSDQSNVTLDGIGVNDQNNGLRVHQRPECAARLGGGIQSYHCQLQCRFRIFQRRPGVSGDEEWDQQLSRIAYEYNRNTVFSANDPFLKYSQLTSGAANKAPKLLRNVFGATFGGPIQKNRLFFFANYEGRRDAQGTAALRTVPSASLRAGDLVYLCAVPSTCPGGTVNGVSNVPAGSYALGPNEIKAMDPLHIGVSQGVLNILQQYPASNENAGDGSNTLGYRFASNADSSFNTYITRLDYHITASGSETLFARGEMAEFQRTRTATISRTDCCDYRAGRQQRNNDRTHVADQSQADQRFSVGLHSSGRADRRCF